MPILNTIERQSAQYGHIIHFVVITMSSHIVMTTKGEEFLALKIMSVNNNSYNVNKAKERSNTVSSLMVQNMPQMVEDCHL